MQRNVFKQPPISIQLSIIYVVGLLLGVFSVWGSPIMLLLAVAGIIYLAIAWLYPEIALLIILLLTSTIFNFYLLPSISIGVGHLIVTDLLLFTLIGIVLFRGIVGSTSYLVHTPLDLPLLAFYGTALLSTGIAIFIDSSLSFNQSLGEVRSISLYLTFFVVTNLVRNEKQVRRLFNGIVFLGIFTALAMIAQFLLGSAVQILPGRVEALDTAGATSYGVARILPPGQSLVLVVFVYLAVSLILNRKANRFVANLIPLGICGLAVILTFNRNFWVAAGIALFVVGLVISIRDKARYIQIAFWTILIGIFTLTPLLATDKRSPVAELMQGTVIRLLSLFDPDVTKESSLRYRFVENEYAHRKIASNPFLGLGLGANFRTWDRRLDSGLDPSQIDAYFLHNGHLYMLVKTGFIGYLFFVWLLFLFVKRGFQNWKQSSDPFLREIVLSFSAVIVGIFMVTVVNPIFMVSYWTPVIGVMLGLSEVIIRMYANQSSLMKIAEESN